MLKLARPSVLSEHIPSIIARAADDNSIIVIKLLIVLDCHICRELQELDYTHKHA